VRLDRLLFSGASAPGVPRIREQAEADSLGISGTPAFIIGLTVPGETKLKTVRFINGAQPCGVQGRYRRPCPQPIAAKRNRRFRHPSRWRKPVVRSMGFRIDAPEGADTSRRLPTTG
jgi:hypothetical protein